MTLHPLRQFFALLTLAALLLGTAPAWAQEDPPGRVGRLAELQGGVSWFDHEQGTWTDAERNRPLTGGDRLSTSLQGRAELRVGSTVLRLGPMSELEVVRLDDERMIFQLHNGSLALRVRSREVAGDIEVSTTEVRLRPDRSGHYRIDRQDDTTQAGVWRGSLRVDDREGFILETGQRAELWRERRGLKFKWTNLEGDAFGEWAQRDDQRDDQRSASNRYVSPEMTGAEDLDRAGRWERHPEYGAVWYPHEVRAGWAPYRYGRWVWVSPWGWNWVDEAPWGFAPFHYGRWVHWGGRWAWSPGDYVARPVYSPALVAWVGGPRVGVSITIGGPAVGWVPLAPREWYVPQHRYTPVYVERVNPRPPGYRGEWRRPEPISVGPVRYNNQGVPGGVTVVPSDVLVRREPIGRHAADQAEVQRYWGQQPAQVIQAPQRVGPPPPAVMSQPVENRPIAPSRNERPDRFERTERGDRDMRSDREDRSFRGERPMGPAVMPAPPYQTQQQPQPQIQPQRPQPPTQQQAPVQPPFQPMPAPERQFAPQRPVPVGPAVGQAPQVIGTQPAPAQPAAQAPAQTQRTVAPPVMLPPTPAQQPAPQSVGPQPPRRGPAAEDERKRGPENRSIKDNREMREQQR